MTGYMIEGWAHGAWLKTGGVYLDHGDAEQTLRRLEIFSDEFRITPVEVYAPGTMGSTVSIPAAKYAQD